MCFKKALTLARIYHPFVLSIFVTLLLSTNVYAGHRRPLNSTPPEISNSVLCADDSDSAAEDIKDKREDFCKLTNSIREWHLSRTLVLDSDLSAVAQTEAQSVFEATKKTDDDADDETDDSAKISSSELLKKLNAYGADFEIFGYHISNSGIEQAHDVVRNSLAVPHSRKQFLNHSFRKIGVGFYRGVWISLFTD